jgi:hypothetical protein
MKFIFFITVLLVSSSAFSQQDGDTVYQRCPVSLKDTVTGNNYFIERRPATIKTRRSNGDCTISIEQKDQFFTIFFRTKKLSTNGKYEITVGDGGKRNVRAKYSFKSGEDAAYLDVSSGKIETSYDKTTKLWHIHLTGLIASMGSSGVSYFKAAADFYIL